MRKLVGGALMGVVAMLGAVIAQQPPTPPTPEKVIEALTRTTVSPAPAADTPLEASMAAVLARYTKMVAAGEATSTPPVPATRGTPSAPARAAGDVPAPAAPTAAAPVTGTLEAIRADLEVFLGRLQALVRKGGQ